MNPDGFGPSSLAVVLGKNEFHIWIIILSDVPYSYVLLRTFCTLIDIDYVGHMLNIPQFLDPMICQVIIKYHNHATHIFASISHLSYFPCFQYTFTSLLHYDDI